MWRDASYYRYFRPTLLVVGALLVFQGISTGALNQQMAGVPEAPDAFREILALGNPIAWLFVGAGIAHAAYAFFALRTESSMRTAGAALILLFGTTVPLLLMGLYMSRLVKILLPLSVFDSF